MQKQLKGKIEEKLDKRELSKNKIKRNVKVK